jgi:phage shock protein C
MESKKLTRSTNDRMLAGVAGGLAEYFDVDPTLVRVLFALGTLFTGVGLGVIIYIILWIVMPEA